DVPFAIRIDREITQDYDIVNSGWAPDYLDPISFSNLWVTGGDNNNMSYSNPAYDELIAKAEQTTDTAEKWSYLQEAERIVLEEDAVVAPIYQQSYNILVADHVKGFTHHSVGTEYSYKSISINK
ncbi:MAG: peptide ABC transporter substrate-binding protein, partial [Bacillus sp. (in: firmicutes)]